MRFGTYYRYSLIKKLGLFKLISTSGNWLDIGCYDGTILKSINAQEKIGVDLEVKKELGLKIVRASVENLPFKDNIFGIITAFDVLEHIRDNSTIINQVDKKLVKGGLFLLSVPHFKERIFPKFLQNWLIFQRWKHIRIGYNQERLEQLFKDGWLLKFIYWNNDLSNLLYFPLQFIWKLARKFAKGIINKIIEIEFIRTKKYSSTRGHIVLMAKKKYL